MLASSYANMFLNRVRQIGQNTKVFGVAGNPIYHSKSPIIFNAAFEACGIDAVFVPFLVENLKDFLSGYGSSDFAGFRCDPLFVPFLSFPHISVCRFDVLYCLSNFIHKLQVVKLNQQLQETLSLVQVGLVSIPVARAPQSFCKYICSEFLCSTGHSRYKVIHT